jgi:hypothetical protein
MRNKRKLSDDAADGITAIALVARVVVYWLETMA